MARDAWGGGYLRGLVAAQDVLDLVLHRADVSEHEDRGELAGLVELLVARRLQGGRLPRQSRRGVDSESSHQCTKRKRSENFIAGTTKKHFGTIRITKNLKKTDCGLQRAPVGISN